MLGCALWGAVQRCAGAPDPVQGLPSGAAVSGIYLRARYSLMCSDRIVCVRCSAVEMERVTRCVIYLLLFTRRTLSVLTRASTGSSSVLSRCGAGRGVVGLHRPVRPIRRARSDRPRAPVFFWWFGCLQAVRVAGVFFISSAIGLLCVHHCCKCRHGLAGKHGPGYRQPARSVSCCSAQFLLANSRAQRALLARIPRYFDGRRGAIRWGSGVSWGMDASGRERVSIGL